MVESVKLRWSHAPYGVERRRSRKSDVGGQCSVIVSKKPSGAGGFNVISRTVTFSSTFPVLRSVSVDANEKTKLPTLRKSVIFVSIVVGVGSISGWRGRTSRRRVISQ